MKKNRWICVVLALMMALSGLRCACAEKAVPTDKKIAGYCVCFETEDDAARPMLRQGIPTLRDGMIAQIEGYREDEPDAVYPDDGAFSLSFAFPKMPVTLDTYQAARESLSNHTLQTLSEEEQAVDGLLQSLKEEADGLYSSGTGYGLIAAGNPQAAESGLFKFCKALPKGGDLHAHDYTPLPVNRFIDVLAKHPGTYICMEEGENYGHLYASGAEIPEGALPLKQALEDGSVTREQIREMLSLEVGLSPRQAWDQFEPFFGKISGLSGDPVLQEKLYTESFRSCVENGVTLLVLRIWIGDSDDENRELLNTIKRAYFTVKDETPAFTVRIIVSNGKVEPLAIEYSEDCLRSGIRLSREIMDDYDLEHVYPFIIGLDLVNEEDSSRPLSAYADFFLSDEIQSCGLQLFLHCGESLRTDNESVLDAVLFGARRLGHSFNMFRYPIVEAMMVSSNIAVEVCPVSNCILGYAHDLRLHPALEYFRYNIPVVICSDDALFMEDAPLTDDYFAVILSWDLSVGDIRRLAEYTISESGLSQEENDALHSAWEAQWNAFIAEWSQLAQVDIAA